MKFISIAKMIMLFVVFCGVSFKTRAQHLASQRPLSELYDKQVQDWLAANSNRDPHLPTLKDQRNLASNRPLPKQVTEYKMKHPHVALNLPDNDKIKMLPSKTNLTVSQIAAKATARIPRRPKAITIR
jgi:hypothetical protein